MVEAANRPSPRSDRTESFPDAGSYADATGAFGLIGVVVEVGARYRDLEPMDSDSAESDSK